MRIVVLGGTGVAGRHVVDQAVRAGHDVAVGSRHGGAPDGATGYIVDVASGLGLPEVLRPDDVIVDTTNTLELRAARAIAAFRRTAEHISLAASEARVARIIVLSIVGIDDNPYGYYRGKVAQEQAYLAGSVPIGILRTTQLHEFPGQVLATATRGPVALMPRATIQPVAARDVAAALLEAVEDPIPKRVPDLAGPEVHSLPELAKQVLTARGSSTRVLSIRIPGRAGRMMAEGALLPTGGRRSSLTFAEWLHEEPRPNADAGHSNN